MSGGNYIKEGRDSAKSTCLVFSPRSENEAGMLARTLKTFSEHHVDLIHIESRSSARGHEKYEFMVECAPSGDLAACIDKLRGQCDYFNIISRNYRDNKGNTESYIHTYISTYIYINYVRVYTL